jgi:hypothetical protein
MCLTAKSTPVGSRLMGGPVWRPLMDDPVARGDVVALASKCSTTVNGLADSDAEACSDPTEPYSR